MSRTSLEKGMISLRQAALLIATTVLATAILFIPALLAKEVGQDAWLIPIIASVFGLLFLIVVISLGQRFPRKNLVEISIELLGPWLGRLLGIIFALFVFYTNGVVVGEFGALLLTSVMPDTPLVVVNSLIVIMAAYGVYLGLEIIARVNEIILPLAFLIGLVVFGLALPEMDFYQLQPVLVHSLLSFMKGTIALLSFYTESIVFLMIFPYVRKQEGAQVKVNFIVTSLLFGALFINVAGAIALMGAEEAARMFFPVFELAKTVHLGGFIERIESVVVGVWVTTVGLKAMVLYYSAVLAFAQVFNLRNYRPIVLPSGLILIALSILEFSDIVHLREFLTRFWPLFGLSMSLGLLVILYLVALVRRKSVRRQEGQANEGAA